MNELITRVVSGIAMIIVALGAAVLGGYYFALLAAAGATGMFYEWKRITEGWGLQWTVAGFFYCVLPALALLWILLITLLIPYSPKLLGKRKIPLVGGVLFIYIIAIWARNYHDYLHLGKSVAVNGRYLVPILIFMYVVMALGLQNLLQGKRPPAIWTKAALTIFVIGLSLFFGGFNEYVIHITPRYGHLSATNDFTLPDYQSIK